MTQEEVRSKVVDVIAWQASVAPVRITPETMLLGDLGLDSLDLAEIEMEIEDGLDFDFPFYSAGSICPPKPVTVGDAIRITLKAMKECGVL